MPRIEYKTWNPHKQTLDVITTARVITEEYQEEGYDLTLRQLYYLFIARDLFDNTWIDIAYNRRMGLPENAKNTDKNYGKLGGIINNARLAGYIDWDTIVDRTREIKRNSHWEDPADILESCAEGFAVDTRVDQDAYIEVWIEKDALVGVISGICEELDVPYFSCRGYTSQSAMWRAAQRITRAIVVSKEHYIEHGLKKPIILHLGDHDPSGINMTEDIGNRLEMFECPTTVKRIALTMEQVREYNPPPNPTKSKDTRTDSYVNLYGHECWELDALDPRTIIDLIRENIEIHTDQEKIDVRIRLQEDHRDKINYLAENWSKIQKIIEDEE